MAWYNSWFKKESKPVPEPQLCEGECAVERLQRFNRQLKEQNIPLFEDEQK